MAAQRDLKLEVTYNDGRTFSGIATPWVLSEFEAWAGVGVSAFADGMQLRWIYYIGWQISKVLHEKGDHPGSFQPTFDGFLKAIERVELVEDESAPLDETAS
tara:strand:+ start:934 stop:1239 length:306 start_codon:yes stop_codon:yes gene_type:complete